MKNYTETEPIFSEFITVTEPTDPAHADNINAAPKQLLQNTLANKKEIEELKQGNNEVEFDDTAFPEGGEEPGEVPDPAEALAQIAPGKPVPVLISHIKRTLTGLLALSQRALNIAMGKNQARVFATVGDLDAWLAVPANVQQLNVGDNFYITATDVPDYWWDGTRKQKLETQKVDLTTYDQRITANASAISELNENITSLQGKITSFENTKSEIAASGLGAALGLAVSNTWAQIIAKLKAVVNRGAWNGTISASGGNVTVPAGYHSGSGKVTGPTLAALVGTNVTLASAANLLNGVTAYGKNGTKYTGTHTCPTLASLVGTNVTLASAANLLNGVTAYGKNGTKYTGTHTCPTLASLVGNTVNLDNNARLLSGYTAYGKSGVKYTGNITNLSNTIDYATENAGDQSHSCHRNNGDYIEVVPRKGYWGNWNWEESCIRVPRSAAMRIATGYIAAGEIAGKYIYGVGFRPSLVIVYNIVYGTCAVYSEIGTNLNFMYEADSKLKYQSSALGVHADGFYFPGNNYSYSGAREYWYICIK